MDMQPLQARFETQDQAESVIRKLASLRGDRFRLERFSGASSSPSSAQLPSAIGSSEASPLSDSRLEASVELTPSAVTPVAEFTLSANVPEDAADQARTVIVQAGGQII
ncbi:hypothetical protein [Cohnella cholangitidis]|uniref:Uncharacterized protein n=1 Tax=Cohnella cholangitidis TaxID=2598458 RepID=A0A7G5BU14_9BACL|nr:hypothetical protein [Cohnella cholangitidis]QMV40448.1 hypothetical protein FPL14_03960 [Cohnella cholangitidis]